MKRDKTTFALFFGNRGFFPASLQGAARKEMRAALKMLGHKTLVLDSKATRYGAVETPAEGDVYAQFFAANRGKFGGVILCLPTFGDETGAIAALKEAGVPILVQAYPDELDKMAPASRRDAFCGKFSIMDVLVQHGVPFTTLPPHTVHPTSAAFAENIAYFDSLCRVVNGMNKCILFHCGPVPPSMMAGHGTITDHAILANVVGEGCSFGCNQGRIAPAAFTYGSLLTRDGDLSFYLGEGRFTEDPIPNEFFGCAGVAEIPNLQKALQAIGYLGHRHHTSVTVGRYAEPVRDALTRYLHYEVVDL